MKFWREDRKAEAMSEVMSIFSTQRQGDLRGPRRGFLLPSPWFSVCSLPLRSKRRVQFLLIGAGLALLALGALPSQSAETKSANPDATIKEPAITAKDRQHWSFRPLTRPEPPRVKDKPQARNGIDRFILARLEATDLSLSPEASRETLIRRLSFDLTGLPPTPREIDAFLADNSPDAHELLVNRLLDSKAYGERWAQHWLDVARFAESDGFEHDKVRKEAWRYRDWVIRALNEDLPYDRFVRWQIAGDELAPDNPDARLATGFLVAGPDMPDINLPEERRHNVLNEMTSTVGSAILGLAFNCAQCHDHKYDPVSQADFYRTRAFFSNMAIAPKNRSLHHTFSEQGSEPPVARLWMRGDFRRPGAELRPGFLRIVSHQDNRPAPTPIAGKSTGRRSELARWLTRPDHPLTLRVIANRLWLHHFGRGLVGTPNDFGTQGESPSHPALLDWLAMELPRRDWSLKAMHRLIVNSATYRQTGSGSGESWTRRLALDPANRLYSRMPRRRLSGEAVRDAMLSASGRLNRKAGGPGFRPPLPRAVTVTLLKNQWPVTKEETEHYRRSIYLFARRNLRYPMFEVFDRPDALASCAQRNISTTAPQSLTLFNSEFSLARARDLAELILSRPTHPTRSPAVPAAGSDAPPAQEAAVRTNPAPDTAKAIDEAYRRILGRRPSPEELTAGRAFLHAQTAALRNAGRDPGNLAIAARESGANPQFSAAFTDYCLALFNLNEFVYVD